MTGETKKIKRINNNPTAIKKPLIMFEILKLIL